MVSILLAAVAMRSEGLTVARFASFDGKSWAGVAMGTPEGELKRKFSTAKTEIADPASVRLRADRENWMVTAVLSRAGGKGEVVGVSIDGRKDPITSLDGLKEELGEPTGWRYADLRFDAWSVAFWKDRGVAAVVQGDTVQRVILARPETLARNLEAWSTEATRPAEEPLVEVGELNVTPEIRMGDRGAEVAISLELQLLADRVGQRYRGPGWIGVRRANNVIDVDFRLEKRKKGVYELEARAELNARTPFGQGNWSATATESATDPVVAGRRIEPTLERVYRNLGNEVEKSLRRMSWQAEWRPFYGLARN